MSGNSQFPEDICFTEGFRSEEEIQGVFDSLEEISPEEVEWPTAEHIEGAAASLRVSMCEKALEDVIQTITFLGKCEPHSKYPRLGSTRRVFEYYEDDGVSGYFDRKDNNDHITGPRPAPDVVDLSTESSSGRQMFFQKPKEYCSRCGFDEDHIKRRGSLREKRYNVRGHLLPPITNINYVRSVDDLSLKDMGDPNGMELICRSCCWGDSGRPFCMDCGYSEVLSVQNGGDFFEKDDSGGLCRWRCMSCLYVNIFGQEYVLPDFEEGELLPALPDEGPPYFVDTYDDEYELDDEEDEEEEADTPSENVSVVKEALLDIEEVVFDNKDVIKEENDYLKLMSSLKKISDIVKLFA